MPYYDLKCPECGHLDEVLLPYAERDAPRGCPNCDARLERIWTVSSQKRAAEDNIPGGLVLHNYSANPVRVYSHTERKRLLKVDVDGNVRRDKITGEPYELMEQVRHVNTPGTGRSPHTVDWSAGSIDAVTLENARILVSRSAGHAAGTETPRDPEDVVNDPRAATHPPPYLRLFNETQVIARK